MTDGTIERDTLHRILSSALAPRHVDEVMRRWDADPMTCCDGYCANEGAEASRNCGAQNERAAIVAFLRGPMSGPEAHTIAADIERGAHFNAQK